VLIILNKQFQIFLFDFFPWDYSGQDYLSIVGFQASAKYHVKLIEFEVQSGILYTFAFDVHGFFMLSLNCCAFPQFIMSHIPLLCLSLFVFQEPPFGRAKTSQNRSIELSFNPN